MQLDTTIRPDGADFCSDLERPVSRSVGSTLSELKKKLDSITQYFDTTHRIVYYDYPIYAGNIGDLLIHLGTEAFFESNQLPIWKRFNMLDLPKHIRNIDDSVVILCHGGGNFGDVWAGSQTKREELIERYPNNRIVVLPQTVHFNSVENGKKSLSKLRTHKNLHIFARDRVSEKFLKDGGLSASCMPDMYHALEGILKVSPPSIGGRALKICRRDHEAGIGVGGEALQCAATDWKEIIGKPCLSLARCAQVAMIGMRIAGIQSASNYKIWYPLKDMALRRGIRYFSQFDDIYTDRLHAMLLGLMLRRRVHAFDNSYGKLSSYYDCWLKGIEGLELSTSRTAA